MNLKKKIVEATFLGALGVAMYGLGGGVADASPMSPDTPATTWSQDGHGGWYWGPGGHGGGPGWGAPWYWGPPPPPPPAWGYPGYYGGGWGHGWGC